jgi:hypothetical protein
MSEGVRTIFILLIGWAGVWAGRVAGAVIGLNIGNGMHPAGSLDAVQSGYWWAGFLSATFMYIPAWRTWVCLNRLGDPRYTFSHTP